MNHILEADSFPDAATPDAADAAPRPGPPISWERAIRCLLLVAVLAVTGYLAWRPALLRLSQLMFLVSPSHGDSLAWKPEAETPTLPSSPRRDAPEPPEWRPAADARGGGRTERSRFGLGDRPLWRGSSQFPAHWRRLSGNPWNWRDDAATPRPRRAGAGTPTQKPATDFRAADDWDTATAAAATAPGEQPPGDAATDTEELPPLRIPDLPSRGTAAAAPEARASAPALAAPTPAGTARAPAPDAGGDGDAARTDWTQFVVPPPRPATGPAAAESPALVPPGDIIVSIPALAAPSPAPTPVPDAPASPASPIDAPESADWKNLEIAGPIAGAYLTIYPKLKFVGLCVPGQGYIRKYNQVATPADTTGEKVAAADGRTPYGTYYIAQRGRDGDGPRLVLSWPSPEDARRLGLDPGQTELIEDAWLGQSLPPQDTPAGGGIALTGLREHQDATDGGFALEPPHMEEIYTALPDGAWVFIQE